MPNAFPESAQFWTMAGRVQRQRPNLDINMAKDFLNERMRAIIDRRDWAALFIRGNLAIPQQTTSGTVTVTLNSTTVTGSGTAWPVHDAVNTTFQESVPAPGAAWVTPASTAGIGWDSLLMVDVGLPSQEICPVIDILAGRVKLNFANAHSAGAALTSSSLSGLQFRVGTVNGIYTVMGVSSATSLVLDTPWALGTSAGNAYQILMMYTTFDPRLKSLETVVDPAQNIQLIGQTEEQLDLGDPNRTNTGSPIAIAQFGPNACGNQMYEIWPAQIVQYQLYFTGYMQVPDMRLPTDRPPSFINPNVLIYGALADAFRTPCPRGPNGDPFLNLDLAMQYEAKYEAAVTEAQIADEGRVQTAFTWGYSDSVPDMGANWEQSHDYDALLGNWG